MTQNAGPEKSLQAAQVPFVLALDIGTSSVRALLFDANGSEMRDIHAQRMYEVNTSGDGGVWMDADVLADLVAEVIDEALHEADAVSGQIHAVAIDTFWHSLLGVDKNNRPLTPVVTWEDTRPYRSAIELRAHLDEGAVHRRTGACFHASYWPAKLYWFAQYQPGVFAQVAQWISFGEYLQRKFQGRSVCTLSMASGTGMLATQSQSWDSELVHFLKVRPEQMPALGDLRDSIQGLTPEYAARWQALQDIPWFPALGDGASACIGSGAASIENWSLTMGTSSAIRVIVPPQHLTPPDGLWLYLVDSKRAVLGGALSEGGNLLAWLARTLRIESLEAIGAQITAMEPDSHGLTILPFIGGERSLGWHAEARMTISGISLHTSPVEIVRACMEALAYRLAAVYERLRIALQMGERVPRLLCSGGALFSSEVLQHIIADTLGAAIYPSLVQESSARGAALLALEALGVIQDVALVPPALAQPVHPNMHYQERYKEAAARQERLYRLLLTDG